MMQTPRTSVAKKKKAEDNSITAAEAKGSKSSRPTRKKVRSSASSEKPQGPRSNSNHRVSRERRSKAVDEFEINDWLLPTLDLERYEPGAKKETTGLKDETRCSLRYAWLGAGKCGARLVKCFYELGYKKVLAVDTNSYELGSLDIPQSQKFLMDTGGQTGDGDAERAANAVRQHQQEILHLARQTFGTEVDHIMVGFGAGGGTGSGSAAGLIEIAKRYAGYVGLKNADKSVGVVMTIPSTTQIGSELTAQNAHKAAVEITGLARAGKISPLIVLDSDRINKIYPTTAVELLWPGTNSVFANLFSVFNRLSAFGSPYTSFDPLDYLSIIQCGGCLVMSRSEVGRLDEPFAISEAVRKSLEQTLFGGRVDLSTAKAAGCIVLGGRELMANIRGLQDNIHYAFDVLSEMTGQATLHRGIYEDNRDSLRVYTIIGGLDVPAARLQELSSESYFRPKVVDMDGPPLPQRKEEILPLAEYFLAREAASYGRGDKVLRLDTKQLLLNYCWPGNVRELAKAMERASELTTGQVVLPDALPFQIVFADSETYPRQLLPALDKARRRIIVKALKLFRKREPAARVLGIERHRLDCLFEQLNIPAPTRKPRRKTKSVLSLSRS
jgi:cell division GTPase FtsZ